MNRLPLLAPRVLALILVFYLLLNGLYAGLTTLFFCDAFTPLQIGSHTLKGWVKTVPLLLCLPVFCLNLALPKRGLLKLTGLVPSTLMLLLTVILWCNPFAAMAMGNGPWATGCGGASSHCWIPHRTVEHQVKDVGALGYADRRVNVVHFTWAFMWVLDEFPQ